MRLINTFALSLLYRQLDRVAAQGEVAVADSATEAAANEEYKKVPAVQKKPASYEGEVYDNAGREVESGFDAFRTDSPLTYGLNCGNPSASTRIADGTQADSNGMKNHPHVVYLYIGTLEDDLVTSGDPRSCQGSIISDEWILTAASCFADVNVDFIRVIHGMRQITPSNIASIATGGNSVGGDLEDHPINIPAVEYYAHPDFGFNSDELDPIAQAEEEENRRNRNNIALVKTQSPIPFGALRNNVCLPQTGMCMNALDGIQLEIAGWGATSEGGNPIKKMREGTMTLQQWSDCSNYYSTNSDISDSWRAKFLSEKEMCAGGKPGDADMCDHDEGGSATFWDDASTSTIVGISSVGYGCGEQNMPRTFTRVVDYLQFIKDVSGVYMAADGSISNDTPVDCFENGRNLNSIDRYDDSYFGFATGAQSTLARDSLVLDDLPHDKSYHIWSWNNPQACLAKRYRQRGLDNQHGKYLQLVQRCDQVRDGEEGRKNWGAGFQFEYLPASGEIVQRGYDVVNDTTSWEDEFCVMLTKKSVNVAACDTEAHRRPRPWSTFDYLPITGAFLTSNRWENQIELNYKYRVLFYPSYMTRYGARLRQGEMTMKHGVFKFSHFGDTTTIDGNNRFTSAANNNQIMLIAEQNEKLFGTADMYCAKVYHHGTQTDWAGNKGMSVNRQLEMVPCEDTEESFEKGSWVMDNPLHGASRGRKGAIYYEDLHNPDGKHPVQANQLEADEHFCLLSTGGGNPVWIRACNPSEVLVGGAGMDRRFMWHYSVPGEISDDMRSGRHGEDAPTYQGTTDFTVYWRSTAIYWSKQCMYVNQKNHRLYVATCIDMNYSFGITREADFYQAAHLNP